MPKTPTTSPVPDPPQSKQQIQNSGLQVTSVRILNFRCLCAVEVFGPTTLLIGENNAGKTSFS